MKNNLLSSMDSFGEYITQEYGLLKQILSYLKPRDLRNAKLVCGDWSSAVDSLIDKNPTWVFCTRGHEKKRPVLHKAILPSLVIHQNVTHTNEDVRPNHCKICNKSYYLCPCTISSPDTLFVSLDGYFLHSLDPSPEMYSFWQTFAALLLPSSPKVQVSTFYTTSDSTFFKEPVTDDVVNLCTGGQDPIKCIIVITKAAVFRSLKIKWINKLLNRLIDRQGPTFAVSGGDICGMICKKGFKFTKNQDWEKPALIVATLRGEGVSAYSNLLQGFNKKRIESFMQDMTNSVGPLPDCKSRVAFIAQCVDRTDVGIEEFEGGAFNSAFPSIPHFGFRAYGEYGMRYNPDEQKIQKKTNKKVKYSFDHSRTSSFLILTFDKM